MTARAILETTPQGQAADSQFVKWLKEHQKEAGVFAVISDLVDQHSDNPAAKLTAQEILDRIQKAQSTSCGFGWVELGNTKARPSSAAGLLYLSSRARSTGDERC